MVKFLDNLWAVNAFCCCFRLYFDRLDVFFLKRAVVTTYGQMMRLNWPKIIATSMENNSEVMRPKWHLMNASNLLNGILWPPKQTTDDLIETFHSCVLVFTIFTTFAFVFLMADQLSLGQSHTILTSFILFKWKYCAVFMLFNITPYIQSIELQSNCNETKIVTT